MPEGPEIHFYYKRYVATLKNKVLTNFEIISGRYIRHPNIPHLSDFQKALPLKIVDTGVKGKAIWMLFENDMSLYFTHGMTGGWEIEPNDKHNRIRLTFDDMVLFFNDMRGFGTVTIATSKQELEDRLASLGVDAMTVRNEKTFINSLFIPKNLDKSIGLILLDQKYVSGIGNYLRAEILWEISISPYRLLKDITLEEKHLLYVATKKIMKYHLKFITKYKHPHYQTRDTTFNVYMRKYDVNGLPVTHEKLGPQTIHWVKDRQK